MIELSLSLLHFLEAVKVTLEAFIHIGSPVLDFPPTFVVLRGRGDGGSKHELRTDDGYSNKSALESDHSGNV